MPAHAVAEPRPQRSPLVEPGQIHHHAADMAVTAAADVTLGALQARLADAGQWAAIDGDPARPLGYLLQHDSTGPLRLGFGGWRDLLTGVQFTDGHGELVTFGGVTVKNVAGYDLAKFMVGSHGCFGAPVTLTLRTYLRPEAAMAVSLPGAWDAGKVTTLLAGDAPPQWLLVTPEGVRAGWLGKAREMAALRPIIARLGPMADRDLAADEAERAGWLRTGPESLRVVTAPSDVWRVLSAAGPDRAVADPVFGVAWMSVPERFSDLMSLVRSRGGYAIWLGRDGVRCPGLPPATRRVLEQLKARLDPDGRLSPLPKEE